LARSVPETENSIDTRFFAGRGACLDKDDHRLKSGKIAMLTVSLLNVFLNVFGRVRVWRDPLRKPEVVLTCG